MNKNLAIIKQLRQNARQSLITISRKTGIPVSTVFDRIKQQEDHSIRKHTSLVYFSKLGYSLRLLMFLKVKKENECCERLMHNKHVNSLFRTDGDFNVYLDCVFATMKEYQHFMKQLNQFDIENKVLSFVVEELCYEDFLINKEGNKNE